MIRRAIVLKNLPFTLVAILEVVLIGAVLWGILRFEATTNERDESRQALIAVDAALISLLDAETGERGYIITGDDAFLEPYAEARQRLNAILVELESLVRDDGRQLGTLRELLPIVSRQLERLELVVGLVAAGQDGQVAELFSGDQGRVLMEEIRGYLRTMRARELASLEENISAANNAGRFIGVASIALTVATLAIIGWLFIVLQRRHESEHLRAMAAAKDEFVGFVSHELRGPIAVIAGNARLMEHAQDEGASAESLAEITDSAKRIEDIMDTLLQLASAESGESLEVEPVLVQRIVQRSAEIHRRRYPESAVQVTAPDELPPAVGNRQALEQVILNLLSNASKYGEEGSVIDLAASQSDSSITVRVLNRGGALDGETFSHVFEPFFRGPASAASRPGIGLGLTVCHRLVAAQGGRMFARALPEGGAEFRFDLKQVEMEDTEDEAV